MSSYKFLSTGELEIPTRAGFKLIGGCSCRGVFEFNDRLAELQSALTEAPTDATIATIHDLYLENERFRFLCDRCLELNAIDPDWIRPHDLGWLLFGHLDTDGNPQPSPLQKLNEPAKPRYPRRKQGSDGPNDFISMLAAIASHPDCSPEEALRLADNAPARLILGMLEERAWHSQSDEDKDETKFKNQADEFRAKFGAEMAAKPQGEPGLKPKPIRK